jgi:hypothetical protein
MSEQKKPTRVGNGKKRKPNWITATLNLDELQKHQYDYNGKRLVNVSINIKEQPDQYGKDVEVSINDYKPIQNAKPVAAQSSTINVNTNYGYNQFADSDMPF